MMMDIAIRSKLYAKQTGLYELGFLDDRLHCFVADATDGNYKIYAVFAYPHDVYVGDGAGCVNPEIHIISHHKHGRVRLDILKGDDNDNGDDIASVRGVLFRYLASIGYTPAIVLLRSLKIDKLID